MELNGQSKLLRIFTGEIDKTGHTPLYEAIVLAARKAGIAGATVTRGILSYGASTRLHTAKLIDISEDLPVIIEIIDSEEKIDAFIPEVQQLMEHCGRGGLITSEKINVHFYKPQK
jgi:PII-like signaling protein